MASNIVKAVRIEQHGGPKSCKSSTSSCRRRPNEVTIRQHAAGLNFIDIYFRTGLYPHPLPHGLVSKGAGVVEAVGADVRHLKKGDRVAYGQRPAGRTPRRATCRPRGRQAAQGIGFDEAAALMLKG